VGGGFSVHLSTTDLRFSTFRGYRPEITETTLRYLNINEAVCQVVTRFQEQTDLMVNLDLNGRSAAEADAVVDLTVIPSSISVQLLRIIQEALTNVYKHAQEANQVNLSFLASKGQVVLIIEDDGEGFDPTILNNNGHHFGLRVMRQRAERLGGNLTIHSTPGKGTRILVRVPITNE
jgi:signal transduction histidine kinase